jgi:hypothetical protein
MMSIPESSIRRRQEPLQQTVVLKRAVKKRKLCGEHSHADPRCHPPSFFAKLSKIWLVSRALKELNRRNAESTPSRIKWKRSCQLIPAADYLSRAPQAEIAQLKAFARQNRRGGPDLTDLRGVSIYGHISCLC